jgi:hypothetical protein
VIDQTTSVSLGATDVRLDLTRGLGRLLLGDLTGPFGDLAGVLGLSLGSPSGTSGLSFGSSACPLSSFLGGPLLGSPLLVQRGQALGDTCPGGSGPALTHSSCPPFHVGDLTRTLIPSPANGPDQQAPHGGPPEVSGRTARTLVLCT